MSILEEELEREKETEGVFFFQEKCNQLHIREAPQERRWSPRSGENLSWRPPIPRSPLSIDPHLPP